LAQKKSEKYYTKLETNTYLEKLKLNSNAIINPQNKRRLCGASNEVQPFWSFSILWPICDHFYGFGLFSA